MEKVELRGLRDYLKYYALRCLVVLIYIVSHLYDYICYPIFFIVYHPWLVRKYQQDNHSRVERRDGCVIYHSVQEPTAVNIEIERNNITTMEQVYAYASKKWTSRKCLGTREILSEEEEIQPNGKVFSKYVMGEYKWRTFSDFEDESEQLSKGLLSLGLKAKDRVAIIAETRAEWLVTANACFKNNIAVVTIYTNLGNDGIVHALTETNAPVAFCSHDTLLRIAGISNQCPDLKYVVVLPSQVRTQFDSSTMAKGIQVQTFQSVLNLRIFLSDNGPSGDDGLALERPKPPTADDIAIIMYTSGSTGTPKGVLLSHGNMLAAMSGLLNVAKFRQKDRYIGYLPLAHVLELLAESCVLLYGIKIGYSSPQTLTNKSTKVKAGSKGDANLLRPTLMCTVPLVLERIYKSIVDTMRRQGWAAEELFHYFVRYKMKWQDRGFDTPLLNRTLFRKIRYFLGGRVRALLSGGAPLSSDTHSIARTCLCVPVMQGYGLTESTACATVTSVHDRTTGRAGPPLMNAIVKLVNWEEGNYLITDNPNPRGEIHIGGNNVAAGYFKNQAKTDEEFYFEDDVRWYKTGDIGEMDADGVLRIIDRKKDLVKLQGGEYLSYGKVESVLKTSALVDNICLHADSSRDYAVAIVVPALDAINETVLENETPATSADCNNNEYLKEKMVEALTKFGVKNGLEKFEIPKKITLDATTEWTPDSGLVTAAFKIRRRNIYAKYGDAVDMMYSTKQ